MMSDSASLVVRVSAQGVSSVRNELRGLTDSAKSAAAAVGAVVSVSAGMSKLVQTARQTDILTASLKTMTGSSENAAMAFSELQKFAAQTPYTLDQSVQAFTKLVALGLNPSQKAIESYGNTAAASIPITLQKACDAGRLQPGSRVVLCGFGGGLSWGAALLDW